MIQHRSMVNVADNSGAKIIQCIRVLGGYHKRYAMLGDIFTGVVKKAESYGIVKKSEVVTAVLVRSHKEIRRKDGTYIRFDDNAAVVIDKETHEPRGTRIFGPVARELRDCGYSKIISLASEVL